MIGDHNEYYELGTPRHAPLRFCVDGFYRLAAKATCRCCGRAFMQVLRCHRMRPAEVHGLVPMMRPDPSDEQIITTMMLKACEHGVGNPRLHSRGCRVGAVRRTGPMALAGVQASRPVFLKPRSDKK